MRLDESENRQPRHLRLPVCPTCGDMMFAPMLSEFIDGLEIRHHWSCESCGSVSQTSVEVTSH